MSTSVLQLAADGTLVRCKGCVSALALAPLARLPAERALHGTSGPGRESLAPIAVAEPSAASDLFRIHHVTSGLRSVGEANLDSLEQDRPRPTNATACKACQVPTRESP